MASSKPSVLVVGASFAGLGFCRQLIENGGSDKFHVVLVDAKDCFSIGGLWQYVWTDRIEMDQAIWSLKDADLPGIDLRLNVNVTKWDVPSKQVHLDDGSFVPYDSIVLACGTVPDPKGIPGIENSIDIGTADTVLRQKQELQQLIEKAKTEKVTFVLGIGAIPYRCPPSPFELTFLIDESLRKSKVRNNARVVISCPVDWPMLPPTKEAFTKALQRQNIEFLASHSMEKVENGTIHYTNGETIEATTFWGVYPIRAPDFVREAIPTNSQGTVTVASKVINTIPNLENSYVIGDCCSVPFMDEAIPKAGEFAWKMGISVANAVANDVQPADRSGKCVAEIGYGRGIMLIANFSEVCNNPNGKHEFAVKETDQGETGKLEWVNSYLKQIFGDKASTVVLSEARKRKRE